jgi:GNAT superfamily N-acetyltransferase
MPISTWDELPIQDENLSPYNLPNQINPMRGAATMFGLEVLNNIATYKSLANTATGYVKDAYDGHFSESPEVSEPLSAQSLARVKQYYPELEIGKEASREQVEAGIDRIEREKAMEYLEMHASPGFASSAALFGGGVAGSLTDIGSLYGTKWITKGITKGSELLAAKTAESAVTRLGGTASVRAQQLMADNAGSLAFLKGGIGLATFTGIEELERIGSARLSHVQTPNEADFRLMDGLFDMASSGLVGGLLGFSAEKLTGKMIDKSFYMTPEQKGFAKDMKKATNAIERERMLKNIYQMGVGEPDKTFKAAQVIKSFFQSSKEETERETLDNVSQSFEAGKTPNNDYIFEVNRHEAWTRLQRYMKEANLTPDDFISSLESMRPELLDNIEPVDVYESGSLFGVTANPEKVALESNRVGMIIKNETTARVIDAKVLFKGQGLGKRLYKAAIDEAMKRGLNFESDETVSESAMRVYKSLEKEGYQFEYNPNVTEIVRDDGQKATQSLNPDEAVIKLIKAPKEVDLIPSMDELQEFMTNEALMDLAKRTEDEVIPTDEAKASYLKSMRENYVPLDDVTAPYMNTENIEPTDSLDARIDAFGDEEMTELSEAGNKYATSALNRKALLGYEDVLRNFLGQYSGTILNDLIETGIFDEGNLRAIIEGATLDDAEAFNELLEASKGDIQFLVDRINSIADQLRQGQDTQGAMATHEMLQRAIDNEFKYIKSQVIRSQRDAIAFENKKRVLDNAVDQLDTKDGGALRQAMNALLDRSLLQFKGANEGTYRKMNDAEALFKAEFTRLLDDKKTMEFWNDTNSSTEITRAIYSHDMDMPMDEFSEPAKKIAEMVNKFYDLAVDLYAKEGILIPKLKGRIHHQWHNPYRILKMPWRDRLRMSFSERREFQFQRWYDYIKDRIDLAKTFDTDVIPEEGEPAYIDINDENQVRDFYRRTFDKIVSRDYRREKTNLLTKRSKQRVLQFKSPEAFAEYTKKFGAGDAQAAVLRELTGMFREIELVKDWGAEPEAMLENVLEHASTLPGWQDYSLRKDAETPRRLMHLMRFGAAHSTSEWGMMFSELVYNLKAYESVTKLGNLFFLNAGDGLIAANALNRFSIPMQESMAKSIKETLSRYSPQEQQDLLRMFGIAKSQYFGGFYRHFEDGTLSTRLSNMLRITMKITGTENSEYSNRSMIGQVLSNWFATHVKTMDFEALDKTSKGTLSRYDIGADEWHLYRDAIRQHEGNDYIGWDTVHEISDQKIRDYLHQKGVKYVTGERVEITRDELAQKYRLMMLDQMDDALNRKSLTETDLLRFKRDPTTPSPINDAINMFMLFKTYGFMWIRRHLGDRIYGRGATGFRVSQIQGTADWHGLMKLMMLSFAMELGINQMKSLANQHEPLPMNGETAMDALIGSLGPISYLTRIDGQNLLGSLTRMAAGPIGADAEKIARIATQFERGFWKGDYTNAQVNSIKFLADQFGGVPMLKSAIMTLWADNAIQNIKGRRTGHIIDNVEANTQ